MREIGRLFSLLFLLRLQFYLKSCSKLVTRNVEIDSLFHQILIEFEEVFEWLASREELRVVLDVEWAIVLYLERLPSCAHTFLLLAILNVPGMAAI